ncbi:complex I 24 kDa subunit family protein [Cyberlindnera jadinii NRRL Y-1542]|uniref:NUHM subunit of mitochondrial NADH:ubiquinone oxidoreductase n=1 Tax=Cyberlindnera jadinii (strain ATCC 18201 / CBS 1600 / BCRC 20928 / JCM 3617 / NBRC 0987 / NRRL Y-1542) TaxID=983966 RepID=A0A1E4S3Y6_CYBJN|nr:NUHM subunit of mitochondrial NADH:ubiquinone oxidoreductase [Cyberlindnera jadinii NRRL Y-1542]ODV74211.1 NUHM subunit of mitochondrial NADH:ubiquinone oxidoreductase [Cyberlindnera jadinii NRRL Y-1542]
MLRRFVSVPRTLPLRATNVAAVRSHHIVGVHRDTKVNNQKTPFTFSDENKKEIEKILAKYPPQYKKGAIMPLLDLGQHQHGFCSIGVMNEVAKICEVPPMRVYEVASFYTMFQREPIGKCHVGVCTNIACMLHGAEDVFAAAKDFVKNNNADGYYSLEEVECSGACTNAPVAEVNNIYFEDLTSEGIVQVLKDFKQGKAVPGPYAGKRKSCEPEGEKTSLFGEKAFDVRTVTRTDI